MTTRGIIRVGISGWTYAPWRGVFYPEGLKREQELVYAASQFRVIEITDTFYATQKPNAFPNWAAQVPTNFVFSIKAPRCITHVRRLQDVEVPIAKFIASGVLWLNIHLGPILWQLPPNLPFTPARLEPFLRLLPHDTNSAATLGRKHEDKLQTSEWPNFVPGRPLRHALEISHESFRTRGCIELLRAHDVALVCGDMTGWPRLMDLTSDFVYCRLLGSGARQDGDYDHAALDEWASRIKAWAAGEDAPDAEPSAGKARRRKRDVFVLFGSDLKVRRPADAMELIRRLQT